MRSRLAIVVAAALIGPAAFAQKQEDAEPYLITPYTMNKQASVTLADFSKVTGKVVGGDDEKVVLLQPGGKRTEVPTRKIQLVQYQRPRRSNKLDFLGSLIGGIGLGYAGSTIGKHAAMSIRSDGTPGRIGPITGGVGFGFLGGMIGKHLIRHAVKEQVTLTLVPEGASPAATAPAPAPAKKVSSKR